jgi:hypothetical protein
LNRFGGAASRDFDNLFQSYARAFARFDAAAVAEHWAFPAFFCARGKRASLDQEGFRANVEAVIAFYHRQGATEVEAELVRVEPLFEGLDLVAVQYRLAKAAGEEIAAWEHLYLASETEEGLRLVAAFADGELDAWEARGTPLGDW